MKVPLMLLILTLSKHLNCWQIFTCSFGHYLNGSWTLVSVWKVKISCHKSCKWPGNGKALASGLSCKSSLWSKPSWHWSHTGSPPCRSLFIPFSSQTPCFLGYFPFSSSDSSLVKIWWLLVSRWTRNCCWSLLASWFSFIPQVKQPLLQNTFLLQPKMLIKTEPAGHWAECPHPCSSSVILVPTPVSFVFQSNSLLNLNHWVLKWIPLVCE